LKAPVPRQLGWRFWTGIAGSAATDPAVRSADQLLPADTGRANLVAEVLTTRNRRSGSPIAPRRSRTSRKCWWPLPQYGRATHLGFMGQRMGNSMLGYSRVPPSNSLPATERRLLGTYFVPRARGKWTRAHLGTIAARSERPRPAHAMLTRQLLPLLTMLMVASAGASARELEKWSGQEPSLFTLQNLSSSEVALSAYLGKRVIVHFFATWCGPCREEIEGLRRFVCRTKNDDLSVLAVSVGEPEGRVRRFFDTMPVNFTVLLDRDKTIARVWRVATLPTTYVLSPELKPKLFLRGELQWDQLDLAQIVKKLDEAN
jgi:peroxiredoxin